MRCYKFEFIVIFLFLLLFFSQRTTTRSLYLDAIGNLLRAIASSLRIQQLEEVNGRA